jgi:uncharacterized lipoprotein YmbA
MRGGGVRGPNVKMRWLIWAGLILALSLAGCASQQTANGLDLTAQIAAEIAVLVR